VKEFLSNEQKQPLSEKIQKLINIKKHLTTDDVLYRLNKNPTVRLYYVVMGRWCNDPQLVSVAENFKKEIINLNAYDDTIINFIDNKQFNIMLNSNENKFEVTINTTKTMPLPETELVENSCVLLCNANELNKTLTSPDGLITHVTQERHYPPC
jgi:hypothetical protein